MQSIKRSSELVQKQTLDNGITLITVENPTADLIAGRFFLKNTGGRWENLDQAGISHLIAVLLTKGTKQYSALEIAEKVEIVGASLGADASTDYFLISLKTVSADFPELLKLVKEILCYPTFPPEQITLEKQLTLQSIKSQLEQPFNVAFHHLRAMMYPHHLYGVSILGTPETVNQITRQDLIDYHHHFFRPENLIISLSGNITHQQAHSLITETFEDWIVAPAIPRPDPCPELIINPQIILTPQESQQSIIMLGYLAPNVRETGYSALKLISTYLGNGLSSRLFVELREKRGLAYDVSAFYPTRLEKAQFVTYIGTAPQNTEIAFSGLKGEVDRICDHKLTQDELETAKNKLLGQYALGKQTNAEIAQTYGWYECLGLGLQFDRTFQENIRQVTPEEVQSIAQKYLSQPYISLTGPQHSLQFLEIS